jgi:hypothetical protein
MVRNSLHNECGAVSVLFVISLAVILIFTAFITDAGSAWIVGIQQSDRASSTVQHIAQPASALLVKNSDTPGRTLALQIADDLRNEGYTGDIAVYFYEPTRSEAGLKNDSTRVYAFAIQLDTSVNTVFARTYGVTSIPVSTLECAYAIPYSETKVYRPTVAANGVWKIPSGQSSSSIAYTAIAKSEMPEDMRNEITEAIRAAASN